VWPCAVDASNALSPFLCKRWCNDCAGMYRNQRVTWAARVQVVQPLGVPRAHEVPLRVQPARPHLPRLLLPAQALSAAVHDRHDLAGPRLTGHPTRKPRVYTMGPCPAMGVSLHSGERAFCRDLACDARRCLRCMCCPCGQLTDKRKAARQCPSSRCRPIPTDAAVMPALSFVAMFDIVTFTYVDKTPCNCKCCQVDARTRLLHFLCPLVLLGIAISPKSRARSLYNHIASRRPVLTASSNVTPDHA
jgi:hypothetical protein